MPTVATTVLLLGSSRTIDAPVEHPVTHAASVPTAIPPHGVNPSGARMVAWTSPVCGSMRVTVRLFGMLTQTLPSPLASQFGPLAPTRATVIGFPTRFVAASTGSTEPPRTSATQTPSRVTRTPLGWEPAGIVAATFRVTGSTRVRFALVSFVAQTPDRSAATPL